MRKYSKMTGKSKDYSLLDWIGRFIDKVVALPAVSEKGTQNRHNRFLLHFSDHMTSGVEAPNLC